MICGNLAKSFIQAVRKKAVEVAPEAVGADWKSLNIVSELVETVAAVVGRDFQKSLKLW